MFREIKATSQKHGEPRRRWFSGPDLDLFLWLGDDDEIVGYQISYDKLKTEKALAWDHEQGFTHHGVDDGEIPGKYPASPLLVADGELNLPRLIYKLNQNFAETEPEIRDFIVSSITAHYL
jgi:hypothetical protein